MTRSGPGSGTSRIASFRRMPPTAFVPPPLVGLSRASASTRVAIKHATLPHQRGRLPVVEAVAQRLVGARSLLVGPTAWRNRPASFR